MTLLHLGLLLRERDLGLHGELEPALVDDLGVGLADHALDRLRHHRAAVELAKVVHRHLARPEAAELDTVLHLVETGHDPRLEISGRDFDLVFALEAFGQGFSDLHGILDALA